MWNRFTTEAGPIVIAARQALAMSGGKTRDRLRDDRDDLGAGVCFC